MCLQFGVPKQIIIDRGFAEDRGPLRSDCPFTAGPRAASENGTTRPAQYSIVLD
jgi:hypothetical protein